MNAGLRPPRPINNKRQNWRVTSVAASAAAAAANNIWEFPVVPRVFVRQFCVSVPSSSLIAGWDPAWRPVAIHHHLKHSSHNREQDKNNQIIKYLKGGNFPWRPTSPASFNNPASIIKRSQILSFIHAGHYRLPAEMGRRQRRSRRSRNLIDFTPRYLVSLFPLFNVPMGFSIYFASKSGSTGKIFFIFKEEKKTLLSICYNTQARNLSPKFQSNNQVIINNKQLCTCLSHLACGLPVFFSPILQLYN